MTCSTAARASKVDTQLVLTIVSLTSLIRLAHSRADNICMARSFRYGGFVVASFYRR
jgi:hypothetical protein